MVSRMASGVTVDKIIRGEKSNEQKSVLSSSTGMTALFERAAFLQVSYAPSSSADRNANDSHILYYIFSIIR